METNVVIGGIIGNFMSHAIHLASSYSYTKKIGKYRNKYVNPICYNSRRFPYND